MSRRRSNSVTGQYLDSSLRCDNCDFWYSLSVTVLQLLHKQINPNHTDQEQQSNEGFDFDSIDRPYGRSHHRSHSGPPPSSDPDLPEIAPVVYRRAPQPLYSKDQRERQEVHIHRIIPGTVVSAPISPKAEPAAPQHFIQTDELIESLNDSEDEITILKQKAEIINGNLTISREPCPAPDPVAMLLGGSNSHMKSSTNTNVQEYLGGNSARVPSVCAQCCHYPYPIYPDSSKCNHSGDNHGDFIQSSVGSDMYTHHNHGGRVSTDLTPKYHLPLLKVRPKTASHKKSNSNTQSLLGQFQNLHIQELQHPFPFNTKPEILSPRGSQDNIKRPTIHSTEKQRIEIPPVIQSEISSSGSSAFTSKENIH
jgi:hypothetical protein